MYSSQDLINSLFSQLQAPFPWTLTEASVPSEQGKGKKSRVCPCSPPGTKPQISHPTSVQAGHGTRLIPATARTVPTSSKMSSSLIPYILSQQRVGFRHPAPCSATANPAIQCTALAFLIALIFIPVMCKSTSRVLGLCAFHTNTAIETVVTPESLQSTRQREKRDLTICTNLNSYRRHKPFKYKFI